MSERFEPIPFEEYLSGFVTLNPDHKMTMSNLHIIQITESSKQRLWIDGKLQWTGDTMGKTTPQLLVMAISMVHQCEDYKKVNSWKYLYSLLLEYGDIIAKSSMIWSGQDIYTYILLTGVHQAKSSIEE